VPCGRRWRPRRDARGKPTVSRCHVTPNLGVVRTKLHLKVSRKIRGNFVLHVDNDEIRQCAKKPRSLF
jgi:hypothetical protein